MELECEKYKDKVDSSEPVCRHPQEYCKFRSACMIHFLEKEKEKEKKTSSVQVKQEMAAQER